MCDNSRLVLVSRQVLLAELLKAMSVLNSLKSWLYEETWHWWQNGFPQNTSHQMNAHLFLFLPFTFLTFSISRAGFLSHCRASTASPVIPGKRVWFYKKIHFLPALNQTFIFGGKCRPAATWISMGKWSSHVWNRIFNSVEWKLEWDTLKDHSGNKLLAGETG